mmetsp:Transcript_51423/g.162555  ORF Transcript_51423/g.162555 Transcript_51423/m.162555 type:complete len:422 (+) Transcript_51423:779-2044(+)
MPRSCSALRRSSSCRMPKARTSSAVGDCDAASLGLAARRRRARCAGHPAGSVATRRKVVGSSVRKRRARQRCVRRGSPSRPRTVWISSSLTRGPPPSPAAASSSASYAATRKSCSLTSTASGACTGAVATGAGGRMPALPNSSLCAPLALRPSPDGVSTSGVCAGAGVRASKSRDETTIFTSVGARRSSGGRAPPSSGEPSGGAEADSGGDGGWGRSAGGEAVGEAAVGSERAAGGVCNRVGGGTLPLITAAAAAEAEAVVASATLAREPLHGSPSLRTESRWGRSASGPEPPRHEPSASCSIRASSACLFDARSASSSPPGRRLTSARGAASSPSCRTAAPAVSHKNMAKASSATARRSAATAGVVTSLASRASSSACSASACSGRSPSSTAGSGMPRQQAGASGRRKRLQSSHSQSPTM